MRPARRTLDREKSVIRALLQGVTADNALTTNGWSSNTARKHAKRTIRNGRMQTALAQTLAENSIELCADPKEALRQIEVIIRVLY